MSSIRLKNKLSSLVPSQLPEFIQSEYNTFVAFLQAYYEFLEQDSNPQEVIQNTSLYQDIDLTIDQFVKYFKNQYCKDIPETALFDRKTLIKNIRQLYEYKGTEKSYRLLFRLLFNKEIEFFYPSKQILKASDGKWKQNYSFFVNVVSGDVNTLIGKNVFIKNNTTVFITSVKSVKKTITADGISNNVFEIFFDNSKNAPILVGDRLEIEGFYGKVIPVPTSVSIIKPGKGFEVGDILTLVSGKGNQSKLKVEKVNSNGGILQVQFLNFAPGYAADFYSFFTAKKGVPAKSTFDFDAPGGLITLTDTVPGFVEAGIITSSGDYAVSGFFAEEYTGLVLREFFTSTSSDQEGGIVLSIGDDSDAVLYITLGTKAKHPGYFENNDGFISDDIFLEDENYYNPYTYVIRIDERLETYKRAVKEIVHPVGTKLYGELSISNNIDVSTSITDILRYLLTNFTDVQEFDDSDYKDIFKVLADTLTTPEYIAVDVEKPLEDNVEVILDSTASLLAKAFNHDIQTGDDNTKDINKVIGLGENLPYDINYFAEDYVEIGGTSLFSVEEALIAVDTDKYEDETIQAADSGYIFSTDYADLTYFAEDYVGNILQAF